MSQNKKHIAILLDGPIANDGRVRRIIHSLAEVHLVDLYYYNGTDLDQGIFNQNVTLFTHQFKNSWLKKNIFFNKKFNALKQTFYAKSIKYDFIYCNDYPLLETAVGLKKIKGSKLIYDSHEIYIETINQFFPLQGWRSIYGRLLISLNKFIHFKNEKRLLKEVDLFVTVCESFLGYFKDKYRLKNGMVIRNCPDLTSFADKNNRLREILNLGDNEKIVLYQGVINAGRGIEKIISASKHFNEHIHFVIIGGGPNLDKMKLFALNKKAANVHFINKVPFDDLLNYTASSDVGIMLIEPINKSKELTLPNKVFEYMAGGIPVITNNLPEASAIIRQFNCGIIIDDKTPLSVAEGVNKYFESYKNDSGQGMNGQKAIKSSLNWKREISDLLKKLANYET